MAIGDLVRASSGLSLNSLLPPMPASESRTEQLKREQRTIADLERRLDDLTGQRKRLLLDDDVAGAVKVEDELAAIVRQLAVHRDRLPILRQRRRVELEDERQTAKRARLTTLRAKLKDRTAAAAAVDAALVQLEQALAAHAAAHAATLADWPHDLFPDKGLFAGQSNVITRMHPWDGARAWCAAARDCAAGWPPCASGCGCGGEHAFWDQGLAAAAGH
jgi:hypothetical protein